MRPRSQAVEGSSSIFCLTVPHGSNVLVNNCQVSNLQAPPTMRSSDLVLRSAIKKAGFSRIRRMPPNSTRFPSISASQVVLQRAKRNLSFPKAGSHSLYQHADQGRIAGQSSIPPTRSIENRFKIARASSSLKTTAPTFKLTAGQPPNSLDLFTNPLIAATLKPATRRKYSEEILRFLVWFKSSVRPLESFDESLTAYILECYQRNPRAGERNKMGCLVAGICVLRPHLKGNIPISNRSLAGWQRLTPPESAIPLTKGFLKAFVVELIQREQKQCAMALALAWAGYLRANEVLSLNWGDVAFPGDPRLSSACINTAGINIRDAKTGRNQFVPIVDEGVIAMLSLFSHGKYHRKEEKLFSLSYRKYLDTIKNVSTNLGITDKPLTTHSTRIGGALHSYASNKDDKDIAITGRWQSINSLRRYLTNGRGWLMNLSFTSSSSSRIRLLQNQYDLWFEKH